MSAAYPPQAVRVRRRGESLVAIVLLVTLSILTACSTSSPNATHPTALTPSATSACAWPTRAGKDVQNIAYPDASATYWVVPYSLASNEHLVIRGHYPDARYFSFITYAPTGGAVGVLTDRDISPDAGSVNPFSGSARSGTSDKYTVEVGIGGAVSVPKSNFASAISVPSSPSPGNTTAPDALGITPTTLTSTAARRVIGTGGSGGRGGTLIYRVYVPASDSDPTGGVGLPQISVVDASGGSRAIPTCAHQGPNPDGLTIVNTYGPATTSKPPATPIFIRPDRTSNNLYPNPDNVYVATIVKHTDGEVVVIRGKAPTFPDTRAGRPITGQEQVRFWSLCTNEYRKPYPVSSCARDDQTALDSQGWFTFVISTPADRPANATAANGVTWLDYGSTSYSSVLLFRHMLASTTFAESATKLPRGALATSTMGPYAPRGAYCTRQTFEAGGANACRLG